MRHHNVNRKFGRESGPRRALLRSLARNLIMNGRIETTEARAKEIRPIVEKLVTQGRDSSVASRRLITARLGAHETDAKNSATKKLVEEISPKFKDRAGGYTRIVKLGNRRGDGSRMAMIEFVA